MLKRFGGYSKHRVSTVCDWCLQFIITDLPHMFTQLSAGSVFSACVAETLMATIYCSHFCALKNRKDQCHIFNSRNTLFPQNIYLSGLSDNL